MLCVLVDVSDVRAPRLRSKCANGANNPGALTNSCPGRSSAKPSIQLTELTSVNTCQKQAIIPNTNTNMMNPFRYTFAMKIGSKDWYERNAPITTITTNINIMRICRTGWVKCGSVFLSACNIVFLPDTCSGEPYPVPRFMPNAKFRRENPTKPL